MRLNTYFEGEIIKRFEAKLSNVLKARYRNVNARYRNVNTRLRKILKSKLTIVSKMKSIKV